jgi:hypothetical protein
LVTVGCSGVNTANIKPSKTTVTYGNNTQDGDVAVNGDYNNQKFEVKQEFTWE